MNTALKNLPPLLHIPTAVVEAFAVIAYGFPSLLKELDLLPQNLEYFSKTDTDLQLSSIMFKAMSSNATEMMVGEVKKPFNSNGGGLGQINMLKGRDVFGQHAKTLKKQDDQAKGMIGKGPRVPISFSKRNWYNDQEVNVEINPEFAHHLIWNQEPAQGYVEPNHNRKFFESIRNHSVLPPTNPIRSFFSKKRTQLKGVSRPVSTETTPIVDAIEYLPQINSDNKRSREWVCCVDECGKKLKLSLLGKETTPIRNHIRFHRGGEVVSEECVREVER
jgi:hypothetical protein